ncbi:2TM domain-containing protein [Variovorax sp. PAMC26660]|uniref:2TM domain-containing protein n=1 Tax=Variovorax sp. PAMC26660 TaxID=2762322 RepID=UPI00164E79AA|nr:2TM domain-containing protein [Variovorax sp. PAMC26660]QNK68303.1 2TM domain-containing protein [Variovorax sp. PAMC26660]
MNHSTSSNATPSDIEKLARRRAGAKMGWYIHAFVYVLVNIGLVTLSAARGHTWAMYPLMGWGLGLLVHGAVVWLIAPGGGFYDRLLERERRALRAGDRG